MIAGGGGQNKAIASHGCNAQCRYLIGESGLLGGQLVLLHQPPVVGDLKRGQPIAGRICEHHKTCVASL